VRDVITVAIVDDHPAIIAGVRAWCEAASPAIQVVASGPSAAVAWLEPGRQATVVVFDLQLDRSGPAFGDLKRLVDANRQVVVYTTREDQKDALSCLDIGAFTYLTKAEGQDHLIPAIQAAAEGRPFLPPLLAGTLATDTRPGRPRLSSREIAVLLEWFRSESREVVAKGLNLSVHTVNTYLDRVRVKYARMGRAAPTKAALVARALQDGLIGIDDLG
jgi:DNA-binding NarL/FixJ family response regulator